MEAIVVIIFLWAAVGAVVGYIIGSPKGRGADGLVLGLLLGWIGWIIVAVLQPSVEAQARRDVAVAAAAQRLGSTASALRAPQTSPGVARTSTNSTRTRAELDGAKESVASIRAAVDNDEQATALGDVLARFELSVSPQRRVNEWMFAQGTTPVLVARYDGILYLADSHRVQRVGAHQPVSYTETATGALVSIDIAGNHFSNPRPPAQAKSLLTGMRALCTSNSADLPMPVTPDASTPEDDSVDRAGSIKSRLLTLDQLFSDGLISEDERTARRRAILDEV